MDEGLNSMQVLKKRLGTGDPTKQMLQLLDRVEALEKGIPSQPDSRERNEITFAVPKLSRSEKMKASWAKRKAEKQ